MCRVCEYERANKQDYCTISLRGMTRFRTNDDTEYIELNDWEQELTFFQTLTKVLLSQLAIPPSRLIQITLLLHRVYETVC